jgi:hypothetical protein
MIFSNRFKDLRNWSVRRRKPINVVQVNVPRVKTRSSAVTPGLHLKVALGLRWLTKAQSDLNNARLCQHLIQLDCSNFLVVLPKSSSRWESSGLSAATACASGLTSQMTSHPLSSTSVGASRVLRIARLQFHPACWPH